MIFKFSNCKILREIFEGLSLFWTKKHWYYFILCSNTFYDLKKKKFSDNSQFDFYKYFKYFHNLGSIYIGMRGWEDEREKKYRQSSKLT